MTVKNLRYIEINTINPLYLHIDKTNGYIEESNGNENLMLVPADERKEIMKKYKELWSKIRELIRTITSSSDDYHEKYLKTKLNLDDDLPQNETLKLRNMIIVVRFVFDNMIIVVRSALEESNKCYP